MTGESAAIERIRTWSEDVARDPNSLSFLPLAQAFREQGRRDAALRLCLRGLERHPTHVDAHHLLGELYRESGDSMRAFDEWDIALRLAPEHAGARRAIGILCAEREDWALAKRYLDALAASGPLDPSAADARARAHAALGTPAGPVVAAPAAPEVDPLARLSEELKTVGAQPGVIGALVLDDRGVVTSGSLYLGGTERGAEAAAGLGGTAADAEQAARHLELGQWRSILLETPGTTVRLAPVPGGLLAVAASRELAPGWVLRLAERTRRLVVSLLGESAEGGGEL